MSAFPLQNPFAGAEGPGRACLALVALCSVLGRLTDFDAITWLGFLGLGGFVISDYARARASGRIFMAVALASAALAALFLPRARPVVLSALEEGMAFTALLVALATLRPAMRRSTLLSSAAAWLVTRRGGQRYVSVSFGGHFLALIFNVGVLQLIGDILGAARLRFDRHPTARHLLLGTMRGSAAIALWSPLTMGFAVVTTAFPALDPIAYTGTGLLIALLLLTMGSLLPRDDRDETIALAAPHGLSALLLLLGGAGALLAATTALYLFVDLPFLTATTVVVPLFAFAWIRIERDIEGDRAPVIVLASQLSELRNEMFIFAASTVIGALFAFLFGLYGPRTILEMDSPLMPVAILLAIWGLAAVSTPPSIPVILLAQLLATTSLAGPHALSLSIALSAGWSLGMLVSPVSATLLLSARLAGIPGHRIAWDWNRMYMAIALPFLAAILVGLYWLE